MTEVHEGTHMTPNVHLNCLTFNELTDTALFPQERDMLVCMHLGSLLCNQSNVHLSVLF